MPSFAFLGWGEPEDTGLFWDSVYSLFLPLVCTVLGRRGWLLCASSALNTRLGLELVSGEGENGELWAYEKEGRNTHPLELNSLDLGEGR